MGDHSDHFQLTSTGLTYYVTQKNNRKHFGLAGSKWWTKQTYSYVYFIDPVNFSFFTYLLLSSISSYSSIFILVICVARLYVLSSPVNFNYRYEDHLESGQGLAILSISDQNSLHPATWSPYLQLIWGKRQPEVLGSDLQNDWPEDSEDRWRVLQHSVLMNWPDLCWNPRRKWWWRDGKDISKKEWVCVCVRLGDCAPRGRFPADDKWTVMWLQRTFYDNPLSNAAM